MVLAKKSTESLVSSMLGGIAGYAGVAISQSVTVIEQEKEQVDENEDMSREWKILKKFVDTFEMLQEQHRAE